MQGGAKNKVYSSHYRKESKMPVSKRDHLFSPQVEKILKQFLT